MAIEKLSVILELVSGNYKKEAKEAADATSRIGGAATTVTGSLGRMIGPAAIAGAVVGLTRLAEKAGENADRLFDLASQTGLSTDALQEWEFVAAAAGAKSEAFSDAVKAIVKNLSEAAAGTGVAADAYERLGIKVLDANGQMRDAGSITDEVFEKLAGMANITERNALAQDIFGKKWEETISILDLGTDALADLREEGKRAVISPEALRNADKFRETMDKLKAILGAQLNRAIGAIAPLLTDVAEAAKDIMDELEPLLEGLGWLSERFGDAKEAGAEMAESDNILVSGWGRMIGELGILNVLTGNYGDAIEAAITPNENLATANNEVHDSWVNMIARGPLVTEVVDDQRVAFSNAAKAADTQRRALINLADAQADLLDPVSNVIRLQKDLREAQERLADAQKDGKTPAEDLAIAAIEVEQAFLRLQGAGAALTPDQIQAFSLILINELGMSEQQALDTLEALNLLDGWTGTATFTLEMNKIASGGGGTGNINTDILPFHTGGVVPGPRGSDQLILAQGGEGIIPLSHMNGNRTTINRGGATINVASPSNNLPQDLQYGALLANHATFGKF